MKGATGDKLLASFDLFQFQDVLLSVLSVILYKKENNMFDEKQIVDQALFIWVFLVIFNPQLLPRLYDERPDSGLNISQLLIEDGLLSTSLNMRPLFREQI